MTGLAKLNEKGLDLKDTTDLANAVQMICFSDLCQKAYKGKPKDATIAILAGRQVGWGPIQALQYIAVINGMPSMYGDGPAGLAHAAGKVDWIKEWWEVGEEETPEPNYSSLADYPDTLTACWQTKRKDNTEPSKISRFSVSDAKFANLWGKTGTWSTYPKRMLGWRARAWGLRDNYSDALQGITQAEEWEDLVSQPEPPEEQQPAPAAPKSEPLEASTDLSPDTLHGHLIKENAKYVTLFKEEYIPKVLKRDGKARDIAPFHAWCEKQVQGNLRSVAAWTDEVINNCRLALKGTGVK